MKPNKAFLFGIFFFAIGNGVVGLGALMALHCDFREIGKQATPQI